MPTPFIVEPLITKELEKAFFVIDGIIMEGSATKDPVAKDPVAKDPVARDPFAKDVAVKEPTPRRYVGVGQPSVTRLLTVAARFSIHFTSTKVPHFGCLIAFAVRWWEISGATTIWPSSFQDRSHPQ